MRMMMRVMLVNTYDSDDTLSQNGYAMGASAMMAMMMTLFPPVGYGARFCNAGLRTAEAGSRRAHRRFQNM